MNICSIISASMETNQKLSLLSEFSDLEPAEDNGGSYSYASDDQVSNSSLSPAACFLQKEQAPLIYNAVLPRGKNIPLLKTLLTSGCERDCYYCPFRAGRDFRRESFQPDEMSDLFMRLLDGGAVQGLFLSSGVAGGGIRTQDRLIDTVDILRNKHSFGGYLHLKIMPGAERDQVIRAMQLANRVSINLEAPNNKHLANLAPHKTFLEELLQPLKWAEEIRRSLPNNQAWNGRWPSLATQFVVGGSDEKDIELLSTTNYLYQKLRLGRVYYSAFKPIAGTPLENRPAENRTRQDRLYQASFLLRDYGFDLEDMPFLSTGNLPLDIDPKSAWAQSNLIDQPVDLNLADRQQLLRIPGIGPINAAKIMRARIQNKLKQINDLHSLGIQTKKMIPYILLDGKKPIQQLSFFLG